MITGAAGKIGRCLIDGLPAAGHDVSGIDVVAAGDDVVVADLSADSGALAGLMDGAEAVVHLAAIAAETDFSRAVDSHIVLTHRVLEAAVTHQVRRVVHASSNHAVGFTPRTPMLTVDTRARPDSFYGFGKAAGEALCSLYHDRHGLEVACLRIGSFRDRPTTRRHLSTWLSPGDTVRLVDACLRRAQTSGSPSCTASPATPGRGGTSAPPEPSATRRTTTPRTGPPRSRARRHQMTTRSTDASSAVTSLGSAAPAFSAPSSPESAHSGTCR